MEKFVLILALLGSVLCLFDKVVGVFTTRAAKQQVIAKQQADAAAQAKAEAQAKAMSEMQQQAANLMKALSAFQGVNGPATIAPDATAQAKPVAPKAPGQSMSAEQKIEMLTEIVGAQSSQMEVITNQLAQIAQRLETAEKRRAPRKAISVKPEVVASPPETHSGLLDGLDSGAPLPTRGSFEIVS